MAAAAKASYQANAAVVAYNWLLAANGAAHQNVLYSNSIQKGTLRCAVLKVAHRNMLKNSTSFSLCSYIV